MAAGLDISRPGCGIAEVDSARLAAHYRTRSVDMRQAEGMAQFVTTSNCIWRISVLPRGFGGLRLIFTGKRITPRLSASISVSPIS